MNSNSLILIPNHCFNPYQTFVPRYKYFLRSHHHRLRTSNPCSDFQNLGSFRTSSNSIKLQSDNLAIKNSKPYLRILDYLILISSHSNSYQAYFATFIIGALIIVEVILPQVEIIYFFTQLSLDLSS